MLTQIANNLACRTRFLALNQHGISNYWGNLSFVFEWTLGMIIMYVKPVEFAINTRAISVPHFFFPAVTFSICLLLWDEFRKFFVRKGVQRIYSPNGILIKYPGWLARNTMW